MGRKSKTKGQRGEREAAALLSKLLGVEFKRGYQHAGGPDTPDVKTATAPTTLHVEVKRDESTVSLKTYSALAQASNDAGDNKTPFVMSKRNRGKWIFMIEATHLIDFCKEVVRLYETQ